jgi:hypothetical protein
MTIGTITILFLLWLLAQASWMVAARWAVLARTLGHAADPRTPQVSTAPAARAR